MSERNPQSQPPPPSIIDIKYESIYNKFIPVTHISYQFDSKTFCFYFPQLQVVIYQPLTMQAQRKQTLERFVRKLLREHAEKMSKDIEAENEGLIFKTFDKKEQNITPKSSLSFRQCARVKVQFKRSFLQDMIPGKTRLVIKPEFSRSVTVDVARHGNMRLFELFIHYDLEGYMFGSLAIGPLIVRHYQSLHLAALSEGDHQAIPLFPFQTFYHDMHAIYNHLIKEKYALEELILDYGKNSLQNTILDERYNLFACSSIDRVTQSTIIYLSSQLYQPQSHKKYLTLYNNGKIGNLFIDRQSQVISTMLNHIENYPSDDPKLIYVYEKFQEQPIELYRSGQIVRNETFQPAVDKQRAELNGKYFIFEIGHITAKNIAQYNCSKTNYTHIILPYNQYMVEDCRKQGRHYRVVLSELPTPKCLDSHLFLAINDNFNESRQIQQNILKAMNVKMQTILLKDSKTYEVWLKKYYTLLTGRKYCVLYSKSSVYEGSQVIQLTRKLLGDRFNLMLFGKFSEEIHDKLDKYEGVTIANSGKIALAFINECFAENNNQINHCHSCKCQVY